MKSRMKAYTVADYINVRCILRSVSSITKEEDPMTRTTDEKLRWVWIHLGMASLAPTRESIALIPIPTGHETTQS